MIRKQRKVSTKCFCEAETLSDQTWYPNGLKEDVPHSTGLNTWSLGDGTV